MAAHPDKPMTGIEKAQHFFGIVQAIATTTAIIVGALWFYLQREIYPRAQVQQSVEVVPVDRGLVGVEVHVRFVNSGKQLIRLTRATVMFQVVTAKPYDYAKLAEQDEASYWDALRPGSKSDRQFDQGELRWPTFKKFDGPIDYRIEPGETDVLVFTFLVPCSIGTGPGAIPMHFVRVASDVHKPENAEDPGFAWKARTFTDLSTVCSKKG